MDCTAPWENRGAIDWPRGSATRALPATIPSHRSTQTTASIRFSCHCSPRPLDWIPSPQERPKPSPTGGGAVCMGRLAGKIALITGGSRGIGAAVAERFAREGAHLVLAARTVGGLEEVDDAVRAVGGSATLVPVDLRDFIKIDELAAALFDRWGRLDI